MSQIVSAVQSALTPAGTNAKRAQEQQQAGVANDAQTLFNNMFPSLQNEISYSDSQVPGQEAALNRMVMLAQPGNSAARTQAFANQANSNAANSAKIADNADAASGLSGAYSAGQNNAIANNAQNAIDQNDALVNSPEYQTQQAMSLLNAYGQTQNIPGLNTANGLANLIYSRPGVLVEPGLGQTLGQIAGAYAEGLGGADNSDDSDGSGGGSSPAATNTGWSTLNGLAPLSLGGGSDVTYNSNAAFGGLDYPTVGSTSSGGSGGSTPAPDEGGED